MKRFLFLLLATTLLTGSYAYGETLQIHGGTYIGEVVDGRARGQGTWTHPDGDSFARYWVRLQETREATRMVDQLLDGIPSGPIMAKVPRIIKVPAGEAYISTENPLGEMGYYVVSKGDLGPFRVKIRTPSFNNISVVPWVMKGVYVPDVITILGSLYFILGDIDR